MDKFLAQNGKKKTLITQNEVMDCVLKFFISGNIAFNQADNPYFRDLVALITCDNDINVRVNRSNVTTRLHKSAADAKSDLMVTLMEMSPKSALHWIAGQAETILHFSVCSCITQFGIYLAS